MAPLPDKVAFSTIIAVRSARFTRSSPSAARPEQPHDPPLWLPLAIRQIRRPDARPRSCQRTESRAGNARAVGRQMGVLQHRKPELAGRGSGEPVGGCDLRNFDRIRPMTEIRWNENDITDQKSGRY